MPLTKQQALDLYRSDDLIGIGMEADSVRRRLRAHTEQAGRARECQLLLVTV